MLRGIELPLHDTGIEPVEFLKSMGISLTPLAEMAAASSGLVTQVGSLTFLLSIFCIFHSFPSVITQQAKCLNAFTLYHSCTHSPCGMKDTQKGVFRVKLVAEVSHTPEEELVVPLIVQLISPPFLGRTVLTAGPAKFGMDLTKQEHGVSGIRRVVHSSAGLFVCIFDAFKFENISLSLFFFLFVLFLSHV